MQSPSNADHATRGPQPGALLHGTTALNAARIVVEGFRILKDPNTGALGRGIYLTRSLAWACEFMRDFGGIGRGVVFQVELAPGTRILRLHGKYDPRTIDSLRREFGAELLQIDFHKALPKNKHLRSRELIELLNFLVSDSDQIAITPRSHWAGESGVRHVLRKSGYMGYGCDRSDAGVVIFDPGRLKACGLWRLDGAVELKDEGPGNLSFETPPRLVPATPTWLLDAAEATLIEDERDQEEWERLEGQDEELHYEQAAERNRVARTHELLRLFRRRFAKRDSS